MPKTQANPDDPIIIKKYANRRLYNTGTSSYITLDDLARMTREDVQFQVVDAKSGDDITHSILTQIIMEEEASGEQMLPVSFLRDLGENVSVLLACNEHALTAKISKFDRAAYQVGQTVSVTLPTDACRILPA